VLFYHLRERGCEEAMMGNPKLLEKDRDRIYLVRDEGYGPEIVAGPIPAFDDPQFEELLIGFLKQNPFDLFTTYYTLLIGANGKPEIEEFLDDYIEGLQAEAWGFPIETEDEDEDYEEPDLRVESDLEADAPPKDFFPPTYD
jgi:hypothetical protein